MDSLSPVCPPRAKRESMTVGRVDPSMEQVGQHESEHARTDVPVWTASDGPSRGTDEPPAFCRRARSTMEPFISLAVLTCTCAYIIHVYVLSCTRAPMHLRIADNPSRVVRSSSSIFFGRLTIHIYIHDHEYADQTHVARPW